MIFSHSKIAGKNFEGESTFFKIEKQASSDEARRWERGKGVGGQRYNFPIIRDEPKSAPERLPQNLRAARAKTEVAQHGEKNHP
jgi:hypothetical protein